MNDLENGIISYAKEHNLTISEKRAGKIAKKLKKQIEKSAKEILMKDLENEILSYTKEHNLTINEKRVGKIAKKTKKQIEKNAKEIVKSIKKSEKFI